MRCVAASARQRIASALKCTIDGRRSSSSQYQVRARMGSPHDGVTVIKA